VLAVCSSLRAFEIVAMALPEPFTMLVIMPLLTGDS